MAGHRVGKRSVALPWSLKRLLSPTPLFPTPSPTLYSFPLSQHFSETLHGLVTIRAFSKQRLFRAKNTVRSRVIGGAFSKQWLFRAKNTVRGESSYPQ